MSATFTAILRWAGLPWPRMLKHKVLLAFVLVVLMAVGNILIVRTLLQESDGLAVSVNVAGRMRMLSQRITLEVLAGAGAPEQHLSRLKQYQGTFNQAYRALMSGGEVYGLTVPRVGMDQARQLADVGRDWQIYRELIASITQSGDTVVPAARAAVIHNPEPLMVAGDHLLGSAEALLNSLVRHARNVQLRALYSSYALFVLDLILLLLAYVVVFHQVLRPIRRLVQQCQEMAAGNFAARSRLRRPDELGHLGQALDDSAAHIERLLAEVASERVSLQQAALVYEHTSEAMVVTDADGHVRDINPAFTAISGYRADEVIGKRLNLLSSSGRQSEDFYRAMWRSLTDTGHWSGDIWNRRKSGEEYVERLTINTSYNPDGSVNCRIGLFSDVTEKRRREASIWHQAHYDHLTELPNRQMFHAHLQQCIDDAHEGSLPFALVFLDLDLFKEVNDTFGHDEGDELLRLVSRRLVGCVRGSDLVARLGGDEFTLIIRSLNHLDDVRMVCEKVLDAIAQPYTLSSNTVHISASIGVTFYPRDGDNAVDLLKHADLAMYAAKEKGRNQYCVFSTDLQETAQMRRDLLRDLQTALDTGQFLMVYQPIVDMRDGRTVKAEALIRWQHPDRGLVSPAEFIPLAEDSGLIVPIGDWAFHEVIGQVQAWRQELSADFEVGINVSPVQFQYEGLDPQAWIQAMRERGLPGKAVSVEITERLLMDAEEESSARLLAFRDAGVQVALDDFGTGYSSLSYLRRFDVDFIKIDQSFVRNLAPGSEDLVLCEAIILMAHQLGMQVIAEGIETRDQHDLLRRAGCDFGQGYWYGRPQPPGELAGRLQREHQAGYAVSP